VATAAIAATSALRSNALEAPAIRRGIVGVARTESDPPFDPSTVPGRAPRRSR
jgi:hypothetical protein